MALFACKRSDDQRDDAGALQYLERALGSMAPNETHEVRRWCYFMAASMSALTRNNPAQARVWRERALKVDPATKPESTDGVDAAIAMAEGRFQDALAHWAAARELMGRGDSGIVRSAKEQIAELEDKCRAALSEAASVPASAPEPSAPPHTEETLTKEPLPWMSIALAASVVLVVLWAFLHR
jgi:hypothetical protein